LQCQNAASLPPGPPSRRRTVLLCVTPTVRRSLMLFISRTSLGGDRRPPLPTNGAARQTTQTDTSEPILNRPVGIVCRAARKLPPTKKPTPANNVQISERRIVSRWRVDPSTTNQMRMPSPRSHKVSCGLSVECHEMAWMTQPIPDGSLPNFSLVR